MILISPIRSNGRLSSTAPMDGDFKTTPQPFTAHRVHDWARGRLMGGSSCLNAMAHVRGHPEDFIAWAKPGKQWSNDGLLDGFRRSEDFSGPPARSAGVADRCRSFCQATGEPVARAYMEAGRSLGVPIFGDHHGRELAGTAPNSLNIRNGRRVTVADAYLSPDVLARSNLSIRRDAKSNGCSSRASGRTA